MANAERNKRYPPGAISLPGLAGTSVLQLGKGTASRLEPSTSDISYAPSESNASSSVVADDGFSPRLRHFTLDRPRFQNRPPTIRARLNSMPANAAPPHTHTSPLPVSPPATGDFDVPPELPVGPPPELPVGPPPDLPTSLPPELPDSPIPDLPLPSSSSHALTLPDVSLPEMSSVSPEKPSIPEAVEAVQSVDSVSGGSPPSFESKLRDKSRGSKATGGRRNLSSLSGLSRFGGKSPAAKRPNISVGKKTILSSSLKPQSVLALKTHSQLPEKPLTKTVNVEVDSTVDVKVEVDVQSPSLVSVTTLPPEQQLTTQSKLETSVEQTVGANTPDAKSVEVSKFQTNSSEAMNSSFLSKSSVAKCSSPDIVPIAHSTVQNASWEREQIGMNTTSLTAKFKSRFTKPEQVNETGSTASPSVVRSVTSNVSKPVYTSKFGMASRFGDNARVTGALGENTEATSHVPNDTIAPINGQEVVSETKSSPILSSQTHDRKKTISSIRSATEMRNKNTLPKKRFSLASLSAISSSPATQASVHTLKSGFVDRRFRLTKSADVEGIGGQSSVVHSSSGRHSAPPSITENLVEASPVLPVLSSEMLLEESDLPPELPSEPPPELPSEPPPHIPSEATSGLSEKANNGYVAEASGLKAVIVKKQSWTQNVEAVKSNSSIQSQKSDEQTIEIGHRMVKEVENKETAVVTIATSEVSGVNGLPSDENPGMFDYSFLMTSKGNKTPSSRLSMSSGDSDLLTAVFTALKSTGHDSKEAHHDKEDLPSSSVYVSEPYLHDAEDSPAVKPKHFASVMGFFEDNTSETSEFVQGDHAAGDNYKSLDDTFAKIQAASVKRKTLETNLTDHLAEDLTSLQQMQQEQDSRIEENLAAMEGEQHLADELLQSNTTDTESVLDSDSNTDDELPLPEEDDLRKSIIVRPPTIYRGEISPQGVRCQETQVDEKSLLFISTDESGRDDCTNVLDVESLKGSRDKLSYQSIEQWSTSEVTDWLRDVGLGQYTPHFLTHQVNGKKLLEIDFRLLDEMDIVSSHERETILAEIYKLSVGSEGDLDSFLEDSLNAASEEDKVKALAAIEALRSPSGWETNTDVGNLEQNRDHLTTQVTSKIVDGNTNELSSEVHTDMVNQKASVNTSQEISPRKSAAVNSSAQMTYLKPLPESISSVSAESSSYRARKLSDKFGVKESSPAIRHAVGREKEGVIRVWLTSLQTGHEYKALRIAAKTSALFVVNQLLEKLEMVDDPLRFYLAEVSTRKGVPDREVAGFECPLQLQSHWASLNETKFELKIKQSGVIKVTAFVPGHKSEEKAIAVSPLTSCQEVVRLALRKFNIKDNPSNYCLLECLSSTAAERVVGDGEYPLMVQSAWKDTNSFHLRVGPLQKRSSSGSDSVFRSTDRVFPSDRPLSPPSGYSLARSSDGIEAVRAKNASLWAELESMQPKVARLDDLEQTVATLRNAYECLQESVAQRERNEEVEKAAMQEELEQLRATCAKQANHMGDVGFETFSLSQDKESTYCAQIATLEDDVQIKAERIQQLENENRRTQDIQEKKRSDEDLLAQRDRHIKHLEETSASQEVVISTLQRENRELRASKETSTKRHCSDSSDKDTVKALKASLSKKDGILSALQAENERLKLKVQDQRKDIEELKATTSHLQSRVSSSHCSLFTLASTQIMSLIPAELTGLRKHGSGLSLADGGSSLSGHQGPGVYIRSIKHGTSAYKAKILAAGDRILEIDGQDVSCSTAANITAALEKVGDCVKLVVGRDSHHTTDGGMKEAEILGLKRHNNSLSAQLDARNLEVNQLKSDYSRLKAKATKHINKSTAAEIEGLQQTIKTIREQLVESEQSREDLRHSLKELEQSSTSAHQQQRKLQEGLQQNIYELQMRLQQAEEDKHQLEEFIEEQESNVASLQQAINQKEEALMFAETEREHAVKLLSQQTSTCTKSTEDLSVPDDYNLATKDQLLKMLQEKEIEHSRQKAYMDQLLSLVIEHAPIVLGKLHAHEEASLKSEEWC